MPLESSSAFEHWLDEHHADTPGCWVRFAKQGTGSPSPDMHEAMDVTPCFCWIDSRLQPVDGARGLTSTTRAGDRFGRHRPEDAETRVKRTGATARREAGA
jgi:uncharacterized protein YdeI (YjbR/CyaY-like superfamily)